MGGARSGLREARFPEVKTLDSFDFGSAEGLSAPQIHTLARGEWLTQPENLILAGPIGTGKTHLASALGVEATKQKRRVLFTRAADLVRQLFEARDARSWAACSGVLLTIDVLIVYELGFVPFDRVGGDLLFNLITDRYERRATVVTTNLAFAEWVTVLAGDDKLTTTLLDRLAHHATVITTKGKSQRMRKRRPQARHQRPASGRCGKTTEQVFHTAHRPFLKGTSQERRAQSRTPLASDPHRMNAPEWSTLRAAIWSSFRAASPTGSRGGPRTGTPTCCGFFWHPRVPGADSMPPSTCATTSWCCRDAYQQGSS